MVWQLPTFASEADYHGPREISLLSSEWDQVGHSQHSYQAIVFIFQKKVGHLRQ